MVYLKHWSDFQSQSLDLFKKQPNKTRYLIKSHPSTQWLILKVTDDRTTLKYRSRSTVILNRFESLNHQLVGLMAGLEASTSGTALAGTGGAAEGVGAAGALSASTGAGAGAAQAGASIAGTGGAAAAGGGTAGGQQTQQQSGGGGGGGKKKKKGKK